MFNLNLFARLLPSPRRGEGQGEGYRIRSTPMKTALSALTYLLASASLAHAHGGGGGPDVVLPPIITSGVLGFVCYWLVILWPSSTKKSDTDMHSGTQSNNTTATCRAPRQHTVRVKQKPRLRKIERTGRFGNDGNSGRKAHDA